MSKEEELPCITPAEFAEAVKDAPLIQRLDLPLPVLKSGRTVFGLMVNELPTPWGPVIGAFPVSWTEHCFDDPTPEKPAEVEVRWLAKVQVKSDDPEAAARILAQHGLYDAEIRPGFEDTRTPGFEGRTKDAPDGWARLVFEDSGEPVKDLCWVPPLMRSALRAEPDGTLAAPLQALDENDIFWR